MKRHIKKYVEKWWSERGQPMIESEVKKHTDSINRDLEFASAADRNDILDIMRKELTEAVNSIKLQLQENTAKQKAKDLRRVESDDKTKLLTSRLKKMEERLVDVEEDVAHQGDTLNSHMVASSQAAEVSTAALTATVTHRISELERSLTDHLQSLSDEQQHVKHVIAVDIMKLARGEVHHSTDFGMNAWMKQGKRNAVELLDQPEVISPRVDEGARNSSVTIVEIDLHQTMSTDRADGSQCGKASSWTSASASMDRRKFSRMAAGNAYTLKLSVWDGNIFLGVPGFTCSVQLLLVLASIVNILLQAILCATVVRLGGDDNRYSRADLTGLQNWRANASELERQGVCKSDFALSTSFLQFDTRIVVHEYFVEMVPGFSWGPVVCTVVLVLWSGTITNRFRDLVDMSMALVQLTRRESESLVIQPGIKDFTIISISPSRLVWMLMGVVAQGSVLAVLVIFGSLWLVHTIELDDLLLNAIALGFITDTDELLFTMMVPSIVQGMVAKTEPLPLKPPRKLPPLRSIVSMCTVIISVTLFSVFSLRDKGTRLLEIESLLCPTRPPPEG